MTSKIDRESVEATAAPLVEHLTELRRRLIYSLIALVAFAALAFVFIRPIFWFLVEPLLQVAPDSNIIYTSPQEEFFTALGLSLYCGLMIGFPFIAAQIWLFVAPGLYQSEKKTVLPFLLATPFLFIAGASLAYYVVIPLALDFLINGFTLGGGDSQGGPTVTNENRVSEFITFIRKVLFAFGVCFQLPVALLLMGRVGVVSAKGLAAGRPYAVVAILTVAALLTPPDLISQVILFVPVYGLYEISIWLVAVTERRKQAELDEEDELA